MPCTCLSTLRWQKVLSPGGTRGVLFRNVSGPGPIDLPTIRPEKWPWALEGSISNSTLLQPPSPPGCMSPSCLGNLALCVVCLQHSPHARTHLLTSPSFSCDGHLQSTLSGSDHHFFFHLYFFSCPRKNRDKRYLLSACSPRLTHLESGLGWFNSGTAVPQQGPVSSFLVPLQTTREDNTLYRATRTTSRAESTDLAQPLLLDEFKGSVPAITRRVYADHHCPIVDETILAITTSACVNTRAQPLSTVDTLTLTQRRLGNWLGQSRRHRSVRSNSAGVIVARWHLQSRGFSREIVEEGSGLCPIDNAGLH